MLTAKNEPHNNFKAIKKGLSEFHQILEALLDIAMESELDYQGKLAFKLKKVRENPNLAMDVRLIELIS